MNIKLEKVEKKNPEEDIDFFKDLVIGLMMRIDELEAANRHLVAALTAYVGEVEDDEDENCDDCDCETCEFKNECFGYIEDENDDEKAFERELFKAQVADAVENGVEKVRHVMDKASAAAMEFANSEQGQKLKKVAATAIHDGKHVVSDALRKFNETKSKTEEKSNEKSEDK